MTIPLRELTHLMPLAQIKIEDGALVATGSIVTKDIGPYEIWVANPAKLI